MSTKTSLTFDDEDVRVDAENSAKVFIGKCEKPLAIDEAQKVPSVFDAIKSSVDRKRIPGTFILSGSSTFSAYKDIRESLTGRIGSCFLYPMTYREAHREPFHPLEPPPVSPTKNPTETITETKRISVEQLSAQIEKGGLPVPIFSRDKEMRKQYWRGWLDTTLSRDLFRVFGRGYDPDVAEKILNELGKALSEGELPTVSHFSASSTKTLKYFNAMRNVFMLKKFSCHSAGTGRDVYIPADSGLAHALMKHGTSSSITQNLVRVYLLNEIESRLHYSNEDFTREYFKSARGSPIDLVWNGIPLKFSVSTKPSGWETRALEGAMKTLQAPYGLIVTPSDQNFLPKKGKPLKGILQVPWTFWS